MSNITNEINEIMTTVLSSEEDNQKTEFTKSYKSKPKLDPLYMSSNTMINSSYIVYNLPSHSNLSRNMFLLSPRKTIKLNPRPTEKIRKQIDKMYSTYNTFKNNKYNKDKNYVYEGYINRPIVKTNAKNLDFSVKNLLVGSPTHQITTSSGLLQRRDLALKRLDIKNGKKGNTDFTCDSFHNLAKENIKRDKLEHDKFIRDLSNWKYKQFDKFNYHY